MLRQLLQTLSEVWRAVGKFFFPIVANKKIEPTPEPTPPPSPAPGPTPGPTPAPRSTALRTMFDSTNGFDVPQDAQMVAGYVDGLYAWSQAMWRRFGPTTVKVRIAISAATNDGHVLDVETGDATPAESVDWALMRARAGVQPTIYVQRSRWDEVRQAFAQRQILDPLYWIAEWDNQPGVMPGAVAHQFADSAMIGRHYDASVVLPYWPGVDGP